MSNFINMIQSLRNKNYKNVHHIYMIEWNLDDICNERKNLK